MEPEPTVERRIVTVLFADIVGFTTISERLDPEDVATLQDAYFATVREILTRYGGRVEKFIGDAVMAVFGLPLSRDDDAERATRAGLALVAAVEHLGARLGFAESALQVRVGVNTGEVVATDAGDADGWRVTGDTVNTAARLQTAARPGGVLLGETASLTVAEAIELGAPLDLELKGKAVAVHAREALGPHPQRSRAHAMGRMSAATLGRASELARLSAAIEGTGPGRQARWLIVAPPGVGKSRLLREVARSTADAGVSALAAQVQPEADGAFSAIRQLMLAALGGLPSEGQVRARLEGAGASAARAAVLAEAVGRLAGDAAVPLPGDGVGQAPAARFANWIEALDRLTAPRPAAWLLEDLQWASPDLLAFLDQAQVTTSPAGRIVIGTARPSLLERDAAWCMERTEAGVHRIDLPPLPADFAHELISALVGDCLPPELVDRIASRADGNPLFIEELLRTWLSIGTLEERSDGSFRLVDPDRVVDLPATVQAIYAGQLDDLPPGARALARRASVAGLSFPVAALPALRAPGGEALDALRTRALVEGPTDSEMGDSYGYRHALLRDAGYATLARAERARLHARLAGWMEAAAGADADRVAEAIAGHLEAALAQLPALGSLDGGLDRAGLAVAAAAWLERAARAALRVGALATADDLATRSLRLTPEDAVLERARRLALAAESIAYSGDMDEAARRYREAADGFAALLGSGDASVAGAARDGHASALLGMGMVMIEQLRFRDAEALAEEGLATIAAADDLATARLRYLRAWARIAYQPGPEALPDLEQARAVAEREGDAWLQLEALYHLQLLRAELAQTTLAELLRQDEEMAALALRAGNPRRATTALRSRGMLIAEADPAAAVPYVERADELAEAHGLTEDRAWAAYARAELAFVRGSWDAALEAGLSALSIAEPNAYLRPIVRTWMVLSELALVRGRVDLLERALAWVDPRRAEFPDSPFGRLMDTAIDVRFAEVGLVPTFVPDAGLVAAFDEGPGLPSWEAATWRIVGAWIDEGRADLADQALVRIRQWKEHPVVAPFAMAIPDLLEARMVGRSAAPRDLEKALSLLDRAVGVFEAVPVPWALLLAHRLEADLLSREGRSAQRARERVAALERSLGIEPATSGRRRNASRRSGRSARR